MRWILASLIITNIVVFVYFKFFYESSVNSLSPIAATLPSDAEAVHLIGGFSTGTVNDVEIIEKPRESISVVQKRKEPVCTIVGSFDKLLKAEYFVERLMALGLDAEVKELVVASKPGFWLHLRPEPSRKEALRRLRELQSRGIDSYVIPTGDLANGISLGMFSNRESALALQQSVRQQGYQPEILDIVREQKEIWIMMLPGVAAKLSAERWAELLSSDQYLQKRQNFCADIASS